MTNCLQLVRRRLAAGAFVVFALASTALAAFGVTIGAPQLIGTNNNSLLPEVSGIVDSRANANTFWVHNDKGDSARFFAISHAGDLLGTFPLAGVVANDWEDIAIGPKAGGGDYLYLGDIGDNDAVRPFITVYRTDEPQSTAGATISVGGYTAVNLQFPGGPRDAESLFVDPLSGDMFIITKRTAIPEIYSVPSTAFDTPSQTAILTAHGNLTGSLRTPTAADISPDGRFILVRSRASTTGSLYERGIGESVADALHRIGVPFVLGAETQGEAIGWAADGNSFYTTSEFDNFTSAPIYSYAFTAPPVTLAGDYNNDHRVDAADYTVWRNQLGAEIALPNEDDTPGVVTSEDYDVWFAHFGETLNSGGAANVTPEPANWLIALVATAALAMGRCRGQLRPTADFQRRSVLVFVHHEVLAVSESLRLGRRAACRLDG